MNLDKRLVAVEMKPGQTVAHDKMKAVIADSGYDVVKIETVPHVGKGSESTVEVNIPPALQAPYRTMDRIAAFEVRMRRRC